MMKRAKKKQHMFKLRHLIYLVLVTSVISSTTLARYAVDGSVGAEASIAAFVTGTAYEKDLDLGTLKGLTPDDTKEIYFNVKNYSDNATCEVPVNYDIQIVTTGNLPLTFSLTEMAITGATDESISKAVGALDGTLCATGGKLPSARSGGETSHRYKLTVNWQKSANAAEYSNEIDHLSVKIKAEQAGKND